MKRLDLYKIEVLLTTGKYSMRKSLYIGARNTREAFAKANAALRKTPVGKPNSSWKLTGVYDILCYKVIV